MFKKSEYTAGAVLLTTRLPAATLVTRGPDLTRTRALPSDSGHRLNPQRWERSNWSASAVQLKFWEADLSLRSPPCGCNRVIYVQAQFGGLMSGWDQGDKREQGG